MELKNVILTEPINQAGTKVLQGKVNIIVSPSPSQESVGRVIKDAHAVIVRTATQVTRTMIEAANHLQVISRTGGGLDNIDIQAATDHKVVVCGVKGPQDRSVAEHTVTLIAALAKQLLYLDREVRKGNFSARFEYRPIGLSGKRVGIIGLGRIGRIVAQICLNSLEMEVWAYDPYVRQEEWKGSGIFLAKNVEEVIRTADFLSLHTPLTDETQALIGREAFGLMKPSAFIINTSRGGVIRESALVEALKNGVIAGAAIDVFEWEPPDANSPLFQLENVILTPHTASLTKDTVAKLAEEAAWNVINVLEGRKPSYSANWDEVQAKEIGVK